MEPPETQSKHPAPRPHPAIQRSRAVSLTNNGSELMESSVYQFIRVIEEQHAATKGQTRDPGGGLRLLVMPSWPRKAYGLIRSVLLPPVEDGEMDADAAGSSPVEKTAGIQGLERIEAIPREVTAQQEGPKPSAQEDLGPKILLCRGKLGRGVALAVPLGQDDRGAQWRKISSSWHNWRGRWRDCIPGFGVIRVERVKVVSLPPPFILSLETKLTSPTDLHHQQCVCTGL